MQITITSFHLKYDGALEFVTILMESPILYYLREYTPIYNFNVNLNTRRNSKMTFNISFHKTSIKRYLRLALLINI